METFYEDNYYGYECRNHRDLVDHLNGLAFGPFGDLNWPVWVEEVENDGSPRTEVGWFLPRKGRSAIYYCDGIDPETTKEIRLLIFRFWAGRADIQFRRYMERDIREFSLE